MNARAPSPASPSGVLLFDKPAGWSSRRAVNAVARAFAGSIEGALSGGKGKPGGGVKAGHAGTLDPAATGLLLIGVGGGGTAALRYLFGLPKRYRAAALLGARTDTGDTEGEIVETGPRRRPSSEELRAALRLFVGVSWQTPPMYSALKQGGRRLYALARRGEVVARPARRIEIYAAEPLEADGERVVFEVTCGSGVYVRALAEDLGRALGTVAHLASLRRLAIGDFEVAQAADADALAHGAPALLPPDAALAHLPAVTLAANEAADLRHGRCIARDANNARDADAQALLRAYAPDGLFIGVVQAEASRLRPQRIFAPAAPA